MIEIAREEPATLQTMEELFDALAMLIGRTLMVHYPGRSGGYSYSPVSPSRVSGELRWLKFNEESSSIVFDMGRPLIGDYSKLSSVSLRNRISVLSDGAWKLIHQPRADKV